MENKVLLTDFIQASDKMTTQNLLNKIDRQTSLFKRTEIFAVDEFGNELFRTHNKVLLGGSLFLAKKLWGVKVPFEVDTINTIMNIATGGPAITDQKNTFVNLFGVGIGGAGDTINSVKDVKYYEREIADMVPLRLTSDALSTTDQKKYWLRKDMGNGKTAYYLKTFEAQPDVFVLWTDGPDGEDGTVVTPPVHTTTRTEDIEVIVEMHLKITKNDVKEYFISTGKVEETRINSIGLFTGVLSDIGGEKQDYKDVTCFSKLNIPNEQLVTDKDMDIYYRVYL